jgi:mono/diheme cytochrome c family protein
VLSPRSRFLAAALLGLFAAGCWEQVDRKWFAQMKEQPAIQALEGRAPWQPPDHTVPVGKSTQRLQPDDEMLLAKNPLNSPTARAWVNPVPSSPESLARGKKEFMVNCAVCHGPEGMPIPSEVPVAARLMAAGALPLPLASTVAYTDGQIFAKITYGKPNMPAYPQISEQDRWHIINYLRSKFGQGPTQ